MLLLPSPPPPAANSFLEKRIHSARIVDWLVVCLACICLHSGKNLKDDGIRQEDVVIFLNFIFVFFFTRWKTYYRETNNFRLITGQFGECGVHFVGQRLVSVLVDAQFI